MDEEETPSKRITRGSIAKSRDNQQEVISKSGNTPLKMQEVMDVENSKRKIKKVNKHKEEKSVDVLISKKKRKVKEIASTSNKEDAQSDSAEKLHFERVEKSDHIPRILNWVTKKDYPRIESFMKGMFSDITFRNITPIPLEIAIISLMPEYVQSDTASPPIPPSKIEADDVIQSPDSDDDFQDPSKSINNKGKENIVSYSRISPTKKRLRQSVLVISKKTPPKVRQDHNIKRPQTRNAPVSPSVKTRRVRHTKQPAIAVTKPVKKEFTDLRKLIQDNFNVVLNVINTKKLTTKVSGLEVPSKSPIGRMQQLPIQSPCSLSGLQRPDEMSNLENNEGIQYYLNVPITDELSLGQKKEESLKLPIIDELSPDEKISETFGHPLKVPITDELSPEDTIPVGQDLPPEYQVDSDFMDDHLEVNKNSVKWLREGLIARHKNKDCGVYSSAYAEFLSDGNGISAGPFDPDLMHSRYATLL
ncbi:hypothetical protein KY290_023334 [Solanum tuberosum]|uniref:Ulp1 protease family, C-terminal catalytic domain containing protein n=1 Tax=Solanum tuberosum TaxID=4113 RepID=A0ABQ7V748_SOLTU|nr:hypothetical protein KY285_020035 [Solanum tuberosum]KAH0759841.1 hypothetical protein KY290_023334 [Solanum tuberosum]